jgi:hypothetical protein
MSRPATEMSATVEGGCYGLDASAVPPASAAGRGFSRRGIQLLRETRAADAALFNTARRCPQVIDTLADAWGNPAIFEAVIDELTSTDRPPRQVLPPSVLAELARLRNLHAQSLFRNTVARVLDAEGRRRHMGYPRGSVE